MLNDLRKFSISHIVKLHFFLNSQPALDESQRFDPY